MIDWPTTFLFIRLLAGVILATSVVLRLFKTLNLPFCGTSWRNFLVFASIWLGLSFLPQLFGDSWQGDFFDFRQALIPLALIFISQKMLDESWWKPAVGSIFALQIFLNVGDALLDFDPAHYDRIQFTLNTAEALVVLGIGLTTQCSRSLNRDKPAVNRPDSHNRAEAAGSHPQGHKSVRLAK